MNWDQYFYDVCVTVSKNTKCFSRRIGAILVRDKSIVSTGYNGPPRGIPHCDERYSIDRILRDELMKRGLNPDEVRKNVCPRRHLGFKSGEGLQFDIAGHAEENCITNAAKHGVETRGTTIFMSCGLPCHKCFANIINAGIIEIVCVHLNSYDYLSLYLMEHTDVKVRTYSSEVIFEDEAT